MGKVWSDRDLSWGPLAREDIEVGSETLRKKTLIVLRETEGHCRP